MSDYIDRKALLRTIRKEKERYPYGGFTDSVVVGLIKDMPSLSPLEAAEAVINELEAKGYLERAVGARLVLEAVRGGGKSKCECVTTEVTPDGDFVITNSTCEVEVVYSERSLQHGLHGGHEAVPG